MQVKKETHLTKDRIMKYTYTLIAHNFKKTFKSNSEALNYALNFFDDNLYHIEITRDITNKG